MTKMTSCLVGCTISALELTIGSLAANAQGVLAGRNDGQCAVSLIL